MVFGLLLIASTLSAQDWARQKLQKSPRHGEWVTVTHDGRKVETFVAYPERSDKAPVIVVIHEIFGMTDWVQEVADEFAAAGYIAVAPDLLSGMASNGGRTKDFAEGDVREAISKLDPAQITADLNAVADYGLKLPSASGKLFVVGFCWGGGQPFRFATNRPDYPLRLSSTACRRRPTQWRASTHRFMDFTPERTAVLVKPSPRP